MHAETRETHTPPERRRFGAVTLQSTGVVLTMNGGRGDTEHLDQVRNHLPELQQW